MEGIILSINIRNPSDSPVAAIWHTPSIKGYTAHEGTHHSNRSSLSCELALSCQELTLGLGFAGKIPVL